MECANTSAEDFDARFISLDLGGNVRKNPVNALRHEGTTSLAFSVGVRINFFVKKSVKTDSQIDRDLYLRSR